MTNEIQQHFFIKSEEVVEGRLTGKSDGKNNITDCYFAF